MNSRFFLLTSFLVLLLEANNVSVFARQLEAIAKDSVEVNRISFIGNRAFDDATLRDIITLRETPGGVSNFFYGLFGEKFGSKAEFFNYEQLEVDAKLLESFYRDEGFYSARVDTQTNSNISAHRLDVIFRITENVRSSVDEVIYTGLDSLSSKLIAQLNEKPAIQRGMPYIKALAEREIRRVLDFLMNHGYPVAQFSAERSRAEHSLKTNNFRLVFSFVPGRPYQFGDVSVHVDPPREDITDNLVMRHLEFVSGESYSSEKQVTSERNLNRLDLFEAVHIDHPHLVDTSGLALVPVEVIVRPRARYEVSPELGVSDENNAFNLGIGLGFTSRNFFGDARTFSAHARLRTQDIQRWSIKKVFSDSGFRDPSVVGAIELQFQILQPYFFTKNLSGSWTSTITAEKQRSYILSILRNRIGLSNRFAIYTYGLADWTLERVNPELLVKDTVIEALTRDENKPQFNSILTFTLQRDRTNDIFSPTEGFFNSISLEESGILPKLLPSLSGSLPFTQYYKVTLFGRWYEDLSRTKYDIFALKLKTGYQEKYGESRSLPVNIPLNRRFFSGGSGSVRGWRPRELGAMSDELIQFGGNFIIEGSIEARVHYMRGYGRLFGLFPLDPIWGVYFFDFGNVWSDVVDFKPRDVALAMGLGFRYETFFGPFRIDYGFRAYDPKESAGRQTIFQKQFFGETLSNGVLHFGIGHAF